MSVVSRRRLILAAALAGAAFATPALAADADCDTGKLQALAPPDTTVAFAAREGGGCRVLWMLMLPDNFNGRYLYLGVGGPAGSLPTPSPALLHQGYAVAGSDAGTGPRAVGDFNFGGVTGREVDFLWRGVHTSA